MEKKVREINMNKDNHSRIKERAAMLAKSISHAKELGLDIDPLEPIEGKMFWPSANN